MSKAQRRMCWTQADGLYRVEKGQPKERKVSIFMQSWPGKIETRSD